MSKYYMDHDVMLQDCEVEYDYRPGTPNRFSKSHGNHLPGDPPEVSNVKVSLLIPIEELVKALQDAYAKEGDKAVWAKINIMPALQESEARSVENRCLETGFEAYKDSE